MTTVETPTPREMTVIYNRDDKIFRGIVTGGALTSLVVLGAIGLFLFLRGAQIFSDNGLNFLVGSNWTAGSEDGLIPNDFSIGPMLVGTIVVSIIALVIAFPLAVGGALYLEFYAPQVVRKPLVTLLDLAASIPSLIFGLWGVQIFSSFGERWATLLNDRLGFIPIFGVEFENFGRSPFIAGCVLASLIIPITTSVAREVYSRTPRDLVDTCYALGGSKWGAIRAVVIPYGRSGVIGGAMLGLGRALGETVAVYLLLNLVFRYNFRILESEGGNVASLIATKFGEATDYELQALVAAGFVLFLLTLVVNMTATTIVQRNTPRA
ncbi:MAG: phosphate ABC transporter permease subunit PstC [Ilumatobacteraceae bacterium]